MSHDDPHAGASLDPVALTLALWLGLVTGVAGMTRLSQAAAAQASFNQAVARPAPAFEPAPALVPALAYGS